MHSGIEAKVRIKHRKSTCAGCRRRKSKCDGQTPKCTTCIAYKDDCHYDKPPSLAYVRSLEEEIQQLKLQVEQTTHQLAHLQVRSGSHDDKRRYSSSPVSDTAASRSSSGLAHRGRAVRWETGVSVDDHGGVTFHNATSPIHEPLGSPDRPVPIAVPDIHIHGSPQAEQRVRHGLLLNARHQRQLEPLAVANAAARTNVPKDVCGELLRHHWCWVHPLFLFVYRPAFTKAMATLDPNAPDAHDHPYFSDTLLKVIQANGAQFLPQDTYQNHDRDMLPYQPSPETPRTPRDCVHAWAEEARLSLSMDILKESAVPTVQALLQQSAREVVLGRSSQAWTLTGVGLRMALDLGIHLPSHKLQALLKTLTPEDVEIRTRLFWSCYNWDKILSLYLGRMPGFTPSTDDMSLAFLDDSSDSEPWTPYYGESPTPDLQQLPAYPQCPGHVVACFRQLCRLTVILNDLLHDMYSPEAAATDTREMEHDDTASESSATDGAPSARIARRLHDWHAALPAPLRIDPHELPSVAPPIHIMSLNFLYHTTVILLHRPTVLAARDGDGLGLASSRQACIDAAAAIHDLIILHANTFGLTHVCYLNAYAVYVAATVAVLFLERDCDAGQDPATALQRHGLAQLLKVLQRTATIMPVLERSYAIIKRRVDAVMTRYHPPLDPSQVSTTAPFNLRALVEPPAESAHPASNFPCGPDRGLASRTPFSQPEAAVAFAAHPEWPPSGAPRRGAAPSYLVDAFLPAFPGQQFSPASETGFVGPGNDMDMYARSTMMEYHFDQPARLVAGAGFEWDFANSTFDRTAVPM